MTRWLTCLIAWIACSCIVGCSSRTLAPPVEYERETVERLREQLERMEWD